MKFIRQKSNISIFCCNETFFEFDAFLKLNWDKKCFLLPLTKFFWFFKTSYFLKFPISCFAHNV